MKLKKEGGLTEISLQSWPRSLISPKPDHPNKQANLTRPRITVLELPIPRCCCFYCPGSGPWHGRCFLQSTPHSSLGRLPRRSAISTSQLVTTGTNTNKLEQGRILSSPKKGGFPKITAIKYWFSKTWTILVSCYSPLPMLQLNPTNI